jgi:hypothetical protein
VLDLRCLTDEEGFLSNLLHMKTDATVSTDAPRTNQQTSPDERP